MLYQGKSQQVLCVCYRNSSTSIYQLYVHCALTMLYTMPDVWRPQITNHQRTIHQAGPNASIQMLDLDASWSTSMQQAAARPVHMQQHSREGEGQGVWRVVQHPRWILTVGVYTCYCYTHICIYIYVVCTPRMTSCCLCCCGWCNLFSPVCGWCSVSSPVCGWCVQVLLPPG